MNAIKLSDADYLLYVVLTNYLTIFSGVLFLLAFILLGLVALRISRVFAVATHWPLLFTGPVGAIIYSVYTIVHGGAAMGSHGANVFERWVAYLSFLACGVLCWWGVRRFYASLDRLTKEGKHIRYVRYGKAGVGRVGG